MNLKYNEEVNKKALFKRKPAQGADSNPTSQNKRKFIVKPSIHSSSEGSKSDGAHKEIAAEQEVGVPMNNQVEEEVKGVDDPSEYQKPNVVH